MRKKLLRIKIYLYTLTSNDQTYTFLYILRFIVDKTGKQRR